VLPYPLVVLGQICKIYRKIHWKKNRCIHFFIIFEAKNREEILKENKMLKDQSAELSKMLSDEIAQRVSEQENYQKKLNQFKQDYEAKLAEAKGQPLAPPSSVQTINAPSPEKKMMQNTPKKEPEKPPVPEKKIEPSSPIKSVQNSNPVEPVALANTNPPKASEPTITKTPSEKKVEEKKSQAVLDEFNEDEDDEDDSDEEDEGESKKSERKEESSKKEIGLEKAADSIQENQEKNDESKKKKEQERFHANSIAEDQESLEYSRPRIKTVPGKELQHKSTEKEKNSSEVLNQSAKIGKSSEKIAKLEAVEKQRSSDANEQNSQNIEKALSQSMVENPSNIRKESNTEMFQSFKGPDSERNDESSEVKKEKKVPRLDDEEEHDSKDEDSEDEKKGGKEEEPQSDKKVNTRNTLSLADQIAKRKQNLNSESEKGEDRSMSVLPQSKPSWMLENRILQNKNIDDYTVKVEAENKEAEKTSENSESSVKKIYTYEELTKHPFPKGVPPDRREEFLSDEEFEKVFKMKRVAFNALQSWRKVQKKKEVKLF